MRTGIRQEELLAQQAWVEEFLDLEQGLAAQEVEVQQCTFTRKLPLSSVDMYWIPLFSWPR